MKNKKRITIHTIDRGTRTKISRRRSIGNSVFMKGNHIGGDHEGNAEGECVISVTQDGSHSHRPLSM